MSSLRSPTGRKVTCVLLPRTLIESLRAHMHSTTSGHEQGGLILGYRKAGAMEVCSVSFPTRWDRGSRTRFHRSERGHRFKALREWLASGRTVDWLGEWHTHPGGFALPSSIDLQTWLQLTRHRKRPMVFIILSNRDIYVGHHDGGHVRQMTATEQDSDAILFE